MLKTKKTKTNTIQKRKKQKSLFNQQKTLKSSSRICIRTSRRSKKHKMRCKSILPKTCPSQQPKIVGRQSNFTPTVISKRRPSLFQISCSVRCKNKTNRFCLTLWSVKTTFSYTLVVVKCGACRQILEIERRTCADYSSNKQIWSRAFQFHPM